MENGSIKNVRNLNYMYNKGEFLYYLKQLFDNVRPGFHQEKVKYLRKLD